jgi:cytochrome c553
MRILNRWALCAALVAAAPAFAGSPATPEKVTVCAACHGADGRSTQLIYPNLAGQYATYLEHALREYRSGARKNPLMQPQAAALSDEEIRQLAAYFAAQPSPLYTPRIPKNN